jgi:cytochrome c biogenesis factor
MNPNNQQFIKGAIITVIIAAAIGALTVLASDSVGGGGGEITGKLFLVSFSLIFFGIMAAISMVVTEKPQYKNLGKAGMIVSAAAFFLVLILIFAGIDDDITIAKLAFALFIASIALAHVCLLHHFNLQNKHAHTARIIATIFISLFSLVIIINIFGAGEGLQSLLVNGQSMAKVGMTSLIIDLAATLLVPLCNRLQVNEPVEELNLTPKQPPLQNEQPPVE